MSDSEEEGYGFNTNSSSRLKDLFRDTSSNAPSTSIDDLRYVPKKSQPTTPAPTAAVSNEPQIMYATAIQLFQFSNEQQKFENVGKVGCAILGLSKTNTYQILCYKSNKEHICVATLKPENAEQFSYTVQNGQYGSFYDDRGKPWSLLFKAIDESYLFAFHIAIAKFSCSSQKLQWIDLEQGQQTNPPQVVTEQCKVSVKYTGWLCTLQNDTGLYKLGKSFDSNQSSGQPLRFKVVNLSQENPTVIRGWNEAVKGMKLNGKRFVVIPSSLGYGANGMGSEIPPNSTLAFQIEIVKIRKASSTTITTTNSNSSLSSSPSSTPPPFLSTTSTAVNPQEQQNLKMRMAKLGNPLPFMNPVGAEQHHEEPMPMEMMMSSQQQQQQQPISAFQQPVLVQQMPMASNSTTLLSTPTVQQYPHQPQTVTTPSQQLTPITTTVAPQQVSSASSASSDPTQQLLMLLLQQKGISSPQMMQLLQQQQQPIKPVDNISSPVASNATPIPQQSTSQENLELQMNTLVEKKILSKLSEISRKIDSIDMTYLFETRNEDTQKKERLLSGSVLMQSVQHLVSTNELLLTDLQSERSKIDGLMEKLEQLRKKNEKYSMEMSQQYITSKDDHEVLGKELETAQKQLNEFKVKLQQSQQQLQQERERVEQLQQEQTNVKTDYEKSNKLVQDLQRQLRVLEVNHKEELEEKKRESMDQVTQAVTAEKQKYTTLLEQYNDSKMKQEQLQNKLIQIQEQSAVQSSQETGQFKRQLQELKESYETRMQNLEREKQDELEQLRQEQVEQITQLKTAIKSRLEKQEEAHGSAMEERETLLKTAFREKFTTMKQELLEQGKENMIATVRFMMTKTYLSIEKMMQKDKKYKGAAICDVVLAKLKQNTFKLMEFVNKKEEEGTEFDVEEFKEFYENQQQEEQQALEPETDPEPIIKTVMVQSPVNVSSPSLPAISPLTPQASLLREDSPNQRELVDEKPVHSEPVYVHTPVDETPAPIEEVHVEQEEKESSAKEEEKESSAKEEEGEVEVGEGDEEEEEDHHESEPVVDPFANLQNEFNNAPTVEDEETNNTEDEDTKLDEEKQVEEEKLVEEEQHEEEAPAPSENHEDEAQRTSQYENITDPIGGEHVSHEQENLTPHEQPVEHHEEEDHSFAPPRNTLDFSNTLDSLIAFSSNSLVSKHEEEKVEEFRPTTTTVKPKSSLFADLDSAYEAPATTNKSKSSNTPTKKKVSLFGDDDDESNLFSSSAPTSKTATPTVTAGFGDEQPQQEEVPKTTAKKKTKASSLFTDDDNFF